MEREKGSEPNPGPERIVLSEGELTQSGKAVGSAFVAGIKMFGPAAGIKIAEVIDRKAGTGLEKHLSEFPGANKELVREILQTVVAELKKKS